MSSVNDGKPGPTTRSQSAQSTTTIQPQETEREAEQHGGGETISIAMVQALMDQLHEQTRKTERLEEMLERLAEAATTSAASQTNPPRAAVSTATVASPGLPDLDKLKPFKGETDTDELELWLRDLKRHVNYYALGGRLDTNAKKLAYATSHLIGGAAAWWDLQAGLITNYDDFIAAISKRFRSSVDADKAAEELYELRQKEGQSVTAFSDRFTQLLTRIPTMHEDDKIRQFKRGLNATLRQKVSEHELKHLSEAIELAIRLEGTFARRAGAPGGASKAGLNALETGTASPELQEFINAFKSWKQAGFEAGKGLQLGASTATTPAPNRCWRCGDKTHRTEGCPLPASVCYYCKKAGHIKADCEKLKAKTGK